ncbi:hypothetical protein LTR01_007044 [Friedmanniomyces endolithicus]|nr:hypothetical protein LTR01_007044 [Friedmanniomyces endolithicus]
MEQSVRRGSETGIPPTLILEFGSRTTGRLFPRDSVSLSVTYERTSPLPSDSFARMDSPASQAGFFRLRRGLSTEHTVLRPRTELSREKDVYKYLHAWASLHRPVALYRHVFPHQDFPLPKPEPCGDTALTSFAQLCTLRLRARRCLITLISGEVEYVLAEATRTMSLQYDTFEDAGDTPWLGCCSFPRTDGINDIAIDAWRKARKLRELPETPDFYYKESRSAHWLIVNDTWNDERYNDRAFVKRSPNLRFFCSIPLRDVQGSVVGALNILDDRPRYGVSAAEMLFLEDSADTITSHLDATILRSQQQRSERLIQALGLFNSQKSSLREWWIGKDNDRLRKTGRYQDQTANAQDRQSRLDHEFGVQAGSDASVASQRRRHRDMSAAPDSSQDATKIAVSTTSNNTNAAEARETQHVAVTDFDQRPTKTQDAQPVLDVAMPSQSDEQSGNDVRKSRPSSDNFDLARHVESTYARASNLMCEAMSAEGVIFVDAKAASATLKSSHASESRPTSSATGQNSATQSDGVTNSQSDDNASDHPPTAKLCKIIGFSTRSHSTLAGSHPSTSRRLPLTETELRAVIKRYPLGKIFNITDSGGVYSSSGEDVTAASDEDGDSQRSSTSSLRKSRVSRDAARLGKVMSGAKTIAFLPIWDEGSENFSSCVFVWSTTAQRFFDSTEDITYIAAFSHSLTAELTRLETTASDKAKGTFISSISHELRSPLHGVLAGAELLQETELTRFQREMTSTITMAGRTLLDTVNHVLDFSKISSRPSMHRRKTSHVRTSHAGSVDLAQLTEDVVETAVSAYRFQRLSTSNFRDDDDATPPSSDSSSTVGDEDITVTLDIEKRDSWSTDISRGAWTRILTNLVGNSLKYTKTGVVSVTLSTINSNEENISIELVVQDSGIGMSDRFLKSHLFTPYKQADSNSTGTGLGLSIVKAIAKDLDAQLDVQSELGKGTRITVGLETNIMEPDDADADDEDKELMDTVTRRGLKKLHLLRLAASQQHPRTPGAQAVGLSVAETASEWLHCEITSGPRCNAGPPSGVCAVAETDLVQLAEAQPEAIAAMMSELAVQKVQLIVMGCSIYKTNPNILFGHFPVRPIFVHQPIGPRKLLRAIVACEDSSAPQHAKSAALYNTTPGTGTPLIIRGDGGPQSEGDSFPWNNAPAEQKPRAAKELVAKAIAPALNSYPSLRKLRTPEVPAPESSSVPPPPPPGSVTSDSEGPSNHVAGPDSQETVLLVEDNPINMQVSPRLPSPKDTSSSSTLQNPLTLFHATQLLKALMKKLRIPFDTAINGAEALAMYTSTPSRYFIILTDISMPIMDGNQATAKIRELERKQKLARTTIVAITGVTSAASRKISFDSGVDTYLTKPVKMKEVRALIAEVKARGT